MNLSLLFLTLTSFVTTASAHGMVKSPRSRPWVAYEDGIDGGSQAGKPPREYCSQCLNGNRGVCGYSPSFDYDDWNDSRGNPMPWQSQAVYAAGGDVITLQVSLTAHHWGHMEVRACPNGRSSTQSCLNAHPLAFVRDVKYGMRADPNYPERGYFKFPGPDYEMQFRLPANLQGSQVLLQWKYITANSCSPPGYLDYFGGPTGDWRSVLATCNTPYPQDGDRNGNFPEQFFNCIEVTVGEGESGSGGGDGGSGGGDDEEDEDETGDGGSGGGDDEEDETEDDEEDEDETGNGGSGGGGGGGSTAGKCCPTGFSGMRPTDDCKSFYHCVHGSVVGGTIPCASGLLFREDLQNCDWSRNVQCVTAEKSCNEDGGTGGGGGNGGDDSEEEPDENTVCPASDKCGDNRWRIHRNRSRGRCYERCVSDWRLKSLITGRRRFECGGC